MFELSSGDLISYRVLDGELACGLFRVVDGDRLGDNDARLQNDDTGYLGWTGDAGADRDIYATLQVFMAT